MVLCATTVVRKPARLTFVIKIPVHVWWVALKISLVLDVMLVAQSSVKTTLVIIPVEHA